MGQLVLACLLFLPAGAPEAAGGDAGDRGRPESGAARLLFVGDILLARNVAKERARTGIHPWRDLDSLFGAADWVMGNLEGAVGDPGGCAAGSASPCFAVPESLVADLRRARFSALSLANNHAADLGEAARRRTRRVLLEQGLLPLDGDDSPVFRTVNGFSLALLAFTLVPGRDGKYESLPGVRLAQKLRLARNFADRVIVFIHWGKELRDWPDSGQIAAARWLVRQGADLIVGAHPHVVQAPACIDGRPVFYSLGNHLFDQKYPQTKEGLIADCSLTPAGFACGEIWTEAPGGSFYPRLSGRPVAAMAPCPGAPARAPGPSVPRRSGSPAPLHIESRWEGDSMQYRWSYGKRGSPAWISRPGQLLSAAPFRVPGQSGKSFLFRLERHFSTLDNAVSPRPYVYELTADGPVARWRGSGLGWPLLDAMPLPGIGDGMLCAWHRGDSFLVPDSTAAGTRKELYRWNGFGFTRVEDAAGLSACEAAWN